FIGIVYTFLATPIYRADALLQVETTKSASADLEFLLSGETSGAITQSEILRSRMILGRAAEQVGLDLVIEPLYLPLLGKALTRFGIERPGFVGGWAWAGETVDVGRLSVDPQFYGVPLM